jgi:hypothetical protein
MSSHLLWGRAEDLLVDEEPQSGDEDESVESVDDGELDAPRPISLFDASRKAAKSKAPKAPAPEPVNELDEVERANRVAVEQRCATIQREALARVAERVTVTHASESKLVVFSGNGWKAKAFLTPKCPIKEMFELDISADLDGLAEALHGAFLGWFRRPNQAGELALDALVLLLDATEAHFRPRVLKFADVTLVAADAAGPDVELFGANGTCHPFVAFDHCQFASVGDTATQVGTKVWFVGGDPIFANSDHRALAMMRQQKPLPLVRVYDLVSHTWTTPRTTGFGETSVDPGPVWHSTAYANNRLFVFGGRRGVVDYPVWPVSILDLTTLRWTALKAPFPPVLARSTATRVDASIYVIGGVAPLAEGGSSTLPPMFRFSLTTNEFVALEEHRLASIPLLREHTTTRVGRLLFVHGGVQDDGSVSDKSLVIDVDRLTCIDATVPVAPLPRALHTAVRLGRLLAFVGGRTTGDALASVVDIFDLVDKVWRAARPVPRPVARLKPLLVPLTDGALLVVSGARSSVEAIAAPFLRSLRACVFFEPIPAVVLDLGLPRDTPASTLAEFLLASLEAGRHSDVQVQQFRAHRIILHARCPLLLEQEQQRQLAEMPGESLRFLLRFLYGDEVLLDDALRVQLLVKLQVPAADAAATLQASLGALFDDENERSKFSDVTIVAGELTFRAHRLFVCRAECFARALEGGMREAQTGVISISDVSPESVRALLRFLYTEQLVCDAEHAVEVLSLADRFQLGALKKHSEALIESTYDFGELDTICELVVVAHRFGALHLLKVALLVLVNDFERRAVLEHVVAVKMPDAVVALIHNAFAT